MTGTTPTRRRAYIALVVLLLTYMMSFVDRTALGVLQESIKHELDLSDWQLGLLSGPAFALLYSIAGIPIARLAERRSRSMILAVSLSTWSLMTMLCGLAQNYVQMLVGRIGVSVGEAGGNPASHSLIADLFPPHERGRAIALYSFGVPVGAFLGAVVAGWLAHIWGWRTAFLWLGPPGFLLAIAVLFLIPPVRRGQHDKTQGADIGVDVAPPPLSAVFSAFMFNPVLRQMAAGASLIVLVGYGVAAFLPSFLIRRHGLDLGEVGLIAGLVSGAGAGAGTLASGFAVDRLGGRDVRLYSWLPAVAVLVAAPCFILGFWIDIIWLSTLLLTIGTGAIYTYIAPTFAQLHNMMEARMRATAASIMYLIINLVGLGIGPPLIGTISDHMTRVVLTGAGGTATAGQCLGASATLPACQGAAGAGISYALMIVSVLLVWAAAHFWIAGLHLGARGSQENVSGPGAA